MRCRSMKSNAFKSDRYLNSRLVLADSIKAAKQVALIGQRGRLMGELVQGIVK